MEDLFAKSYHLELVCSPNEPLNGTLVQLSDKGELDKDEYIIEDEYGDEKEKNLIAITLNGGHIYLLTPKLPKPSNKDSFMHIVTCLYPKSWHMLFSSYYEYFHDIANVIERVDRRNLVPSVADIFKAFYLTPLHKIKVVIFASEPCNKEGEATGLAYGNYRGPDDTLKSIYAEIYRNHKDYYDKQKYTTPTHAILDEWALNGVFLLNMSLTGVVGQKGAHKDMWLPFVRRTVEIICRQNENIIFMLWGSETKFIKDFVPNKHKCLIASHPLFRGAARDPFVGCAHFRTANEILLNEIKTSPIKWRLNELRK
jgi:uracil-DNA glycosylase